jgi:hypothetical protein
MRDQLPYRGPKYFYGAWLSLGRLFFILHIKNDAYERDMSDLFKFYIGWDSPDRKIGEALYTLFELRWSRYDTSGIEFTFQFGRWFFTKGPHHTLYDIFGKRKNSIE